MLRQAAPCATLPAAGAPMSHVTYRIVRHDDGWAYTVDGVFSEPFPTHDAALAAARTAAAEQRVPGNTEHHFEHGWSLAPDACPRLASHHGVRRAPRRGDRGRKRNGGPVQAHDRLHADERLHLSRDQLFGAPALGRDLYRRPTGLALRLYELQQRA